MNKKRKEKARINKKGISLWISFVLLVSFGLVMGMIVYSWLVGYVKESGNEITKTVYNYETCDYISASIDDASFSTSNKIISLNVTNRNNLRISELIYRVYNPDNVPEVVESLNITIKPQKTKEIQLNLNMTNASIIEIVPILKKDNLVIICTEKKASSPVLSY